MNEREFVFWFFAVALALPYCVVALLRWRRRSQEIRAPEPIKENNYSALRNQAFSQCNEQNHSSTNEADSNPCAVVMDWAVRTRVATVVAVSDGSASIYFSSGGGSIGGAYARPAIREAALHAVSISGKFLGGMLLTESFPLPDRGGVIFYVVTGKGVYSARASVELLSTNKHPLSELGQAMQEIILQYRLLETTVQ